MEGGIETGVDYLQRYSSARPQVESRVLPALKVRIVRIRLEIQALMVVSHDHSCGDLNRDVQEGERKHNRDSYLMLRCHLQSPR